MYRYKDIGYIAHPKTASVAIAVALKENGWKETAKHHKLDPELPPKVISVIREPMDWYVSWYYFTNYRQTPRPSFKDWLPQFLADPKWTDHHNGFHGLKYTTHLVFYDRLEVGLNAALEDLGLKTVKLQVLNRKDRPDTPINGYFDENLKNLLDKDMIRLYTLRREQLGNDLFLRIK